MKVILLPVFIGIAVAQTATYQTAYGQCGGNGWAGPTACAGGYYCKKSDSYFSQCVPGSDPDSTFTGYPPLPTPTGQKVRYAGINIAGFEFGCNGDGQCGIDSAYDIVNWNTGLQQIYHFTQDDKLNAFRLPVGWQFLVKGVVGGPMNETNFKLYDALVQGCLKSGAHLCIIDLHNYARWNGKIIGQGGPTNAQFADMWSQLASRYKNESRIAFGLMNEPHDVPDIEAWAASCQAAVTAIRNAGAKTQMILLPGNNWTSAEMFVSNGSGAALLKVKNPDGSTTGLIFDVHKYLDSDNSGTSPECVRNNIDNAFAPLATWLREQKRQAFLSETGGGNTASCEKYMCEQLAYLNTNNDVYLGWTGWGAGGFATGYVLSETPQLVGNNWVDQSLVAKCIAKAFNS